MTRLIERWFPCKEVSENSTAGWGSGNTERALFTWFAARPTAQAKAAVICSLLPWPDEEAGQKRLQDLVKLAMTGRYAAWDELRTEILVSLWIKSAHVMDHRVWCLSMELPRDLSSTFTTKAALGLGVMKIPSPI